MCFDDVVGQARLIKRKFCPCPEGQAREKLAVDQADFIERKRQAEVLLMQAGLSVGRYENFRLNNWDPKRQGGDALRVFDAVESYIATVTKQGRNWLYLYGGYGLGKTHLAVAAIRKIAGDRLWRPHVIVWPELCDQTQEGWGSRNGAESAMWGAARAARVLLIDDLDKTPTGEWAMTKLYSLLNGRCDRRLPTIITANRSVVQLRKVWSAPTQKDHVKDTGGAVLSRIWGQLVKAVEFEGQDQRLVVAAALGSEEVLVADKPYRVQRKRIKGWTMPENTVYVGRSNRKPGTGFGNPFPWSEYLADTDAEKKRLAKIDFKAWLGGFFPKAHPKQRRWILDHEHELSSKNVACWCGLDEPCHADVYLERQEARR